MTWPPTRTPPHRKDTAPLAAETELQSFPCCCPGLGVFLSLFPVDFPGAGRGAGWGQASDSRAGVDEPQPGGCPGTRTLQRKPSQQSRSGPGPDLALAVPDAQVLSTLLLTWVWWCLSLLPPAGRSLWVSGFSHSWHPLPAAPGRHLATGWIAVHRWAVLSHPSVAAPATPGPGPPAGCCPSAFWS